MRKVIDHNEGYRVISFTTSDPAPKTIVWALESNDPDSTRNFSRNEREGISASIEKIVNTAEGVDYDLTINSSIAIVYCKGICGSSNFGGRST